MSRASELMKKYMGEVRGLGWQTGSLHIEACTSWIFEKTESINLDLFVT